MCIYRSVWNLKYLTWQPYTLCGLAWSAGERDPLQKGHIVQKYIIIIIIIALFLYFVCLLFSTHARFVIGLWAVKFAL
jgi:hypothetical protein